MDEPAPEASSPASCGKRSRRMWHGLRTSNPARSVTNLPGPQWHESLQPLPWASPCLPLREGVGEENPSPPLRALGGSRLILEGIFIPSRLATDTRQCSPPSQLSPHCADPAHGYITQLPPRPGALQPHHGFLIMRSAGLEPGSLCCPALCPETQGPCSPGPHTAALSLDPCRGLSEWGL